MSIFLSNEVIAFMLLELVLVTLMGIALVSVVAILKGWDFSSTSNLQYTLEKKNYLVNTILFFTITCKIVLFVYFVHTLDILSLIVPGAMCSAGVVGANAYGLILLLLKLILIFGFGIWLIVNKLDLLHVEFPYIRKKYYMFIILFVFSLLELGLEYLYFSNIPLTVPVFCCSTVFQSPQLPFGYSKDAIGLFFYTMLGVIIVLNTLKIQVASFSANVIFLFVGYYAITYFFGIYVYEMPNHQCPYCLLQNDYFYIGYVIWGALFLGVFYGMAPFVLDRITGKDYDNYFVRSSICLVILALVCSFYVAKYYLKTGLLL